MILFCGKIEAIIPQNRPAIEIGFFPQNPIFGICETPAPWLSQKRADTQVRPHPWRFITAFWFF